MQRPRLTVFSVPILSQLCLFDICLCALGTGSRPLSRGVRARNKIAETIGGIAR